MEKNQIIEQIEKTLRANIEELTRALEGYEAGSNLDEGDTIDPEDYSQQSEQRELRVQMQVQLDQANNQLNRLLNYAQQKASSQVEPGALVETDKSLFFIGLSMASFNVDHKDLYSVSVDSPAYQSIRGKSEGEQFAIGKETHTIRHIF